jgi:thiazole synthase
MTQEAPTITPTGEAWLTLGDLRFRSRLLVGIEQYASPRLVADVLRASGADVFITTYDLNSTRSSLLLSDLDAAVDLDTSIWIGTTSFAHSADDAVETARRLRAALGLHVIKLDVRDDTNLPDAGQTIIAAKELIADGFEILPFVRPEMTTVTELQALGCRAIRLMASPVASYRGLDDPAALSACVRVLDVPAVIEGGLGSPEDVTRAFDLGADAVLVNTLIARAADPVAMAAAVRRASRAQGALDAP